MNPIVYVNGDYLPSRQATLSIFDRGLLFGDAVYEVAGVLDQKLVTPHSVITLFSSIIKAS